VTKKWRTKQNRRQRPSILIVEDERVVAKDLHPVLIAGPPRGEPWSWFPWEFLANEMFVPVPHATVSPQEAAGRSTFSRWRPRVEPG
jgi:hypothetical protein